MNLVDFRIGLKKLLQGFVFARGGWEGGGGRCRANPEEESPIGRGGGAMPRQPWRRIANREGEGTPTIVPFKKKNFYFIIFFLGGGWLLWLPLDPPMLIIIV